ncbi:ATP synthase F1 subunit epsilon [Aeoliella sp. ICT_H6.2]|uniref:ATP synthase epsilon chain n=1 Tax=Aeoliella straminimaris TaxID=2954799 RepID=A0A9X2FGS6_9BACT|nr:ATP synthase F1 subunit epsilon [Aeoliella straminimaris]MCO6048153.1 ATP synthase F1 subunit epsilon [Aeoliella straminimaris]
MADPANNSTNMKLVVVTPEATVLDVTAEFLVVPLYDGELGIARNHAPMIGRLGFGELRYRNGGQTASYYVDGGFVQVQDNMVSVLTNRALAAEEIDAAAAEAQLSEAIASKTTNAQQMAIRERLMLQARAQKRMASKA